MSGPRGHRRMASFRRGIPSQGGPPGGVVVRESTSGRSAPRRPLGSSDRPRPPPLSPINVLHEPPDHSKALGDEKGNILIRSAQCGIRILIKITLSHHHTLKKNATFPLSHRGSTYFHERVKFATTIIIIIIIIHMMGFGERRKGSGAAALPIVGWWN